jgi:uncharacterized cupin superfamily protein
VAIIEIDPGRRSTPPHVHADEDEVFYVLAGVGLSWQSSGSTDLRAYEIREGDVLVHESGGPAHTLIAGEHGLTVLVLAEGSRTGITYLPRTKGFWLGSRWSPADAPPPFAADAELGPLEVPAPSAERPRSIVASADCPLESERRGRFGISYRDLGRAGGCHRLVMSVDELDPGARSCPMHWHTVREECFFVLGGTGSVTLGTERHELRPGHFLMRPPGTQMAHAIDSGPEGLRYLTMGDLLPGDVCVYPESGKVSFGRSAMFRIDPVDYYDGEPDGAI